jgi:hypothetical protein
MNRVISEGQKDNSRYSTPRKIQNSVLHGARRALLVRLGWRRVAANLNQRLALEVSAVFPYIRLISLAPGATSVPIEIALMPWLGRGMQAADPTQSDFSGQNTLFAAVGGSTPGKSPVPLLQSCDTCTGDCSSCTTCSTCSDCATCTCS